MSFFKSFKLKLIATIIAIVAALVAVAILLTVLLFPSANLSSDYVSTLNSSNYDTYIPSCDISISSEAESELSDQTILNESQTVVSAPQPPVQTTPTDSTAVQPLKSKYEVPTDSNTFDITLSFAGDTLLATNNDESYGGSFNSYAATREPSYFLEKVKHIFEADDFTIVNLENVLTDRELTPVVKDYEPAFWFKAPTSNINILTSASVEGASIANNHIHDYGPEGYTDTYSAVVNAGLLCGDTGHIMYFEKGGYVVSVICTGLWSEYHANSVINLIKKAEQHSHYQVVFFHGGAEAVHEAEEWKKSASRKFVDNGADLVVGGHPHVLQPREFYNGAEIVYSIGNFCYGGHRKPQNRTVIYQMTLTIGKDLTLQASNSNIIPCYVYTDTINNFQPAIVDDEGVKTRILDFMDGKILSPV